MSAAKPDLSKALQAAEQERDALKAETGWLVERQNGDGLMYAMGTRWDRDASKALRFARQEDAEAFAATHTPDFTRTAEHRWS